MLRMLASACLFLSLVGTALPAAAVQWRGYSYTSASQPSYQALEQIGKEFSEATNGEFTFKFNVGGSLPIPATNITQALGDGLIEIAGDGFYTSSLPIGGIAFLPMLFSTREEFDAGYKVLEPYLEEAMRASGVKLLAHYYYPLQTMFANVPVTSLDEMRGKRMRVTSAEQAEFVRRLGGSPVTIGTPEVPTSLQRGVINVVFTASSGGARGYPEMLTHNFRLGPNFHLSFYAVNLKKFNELSSDHQQKLVDIARRAGAKATASYAELEDKNTDEYKQRGIVVTNPTEADVKRATEAVKDFWGEWATKQGPKAEEALKKIRAAISK